MAPPSGSERAPPSATCCARCAPAAPIALRRQLARDRAGRARARHRGGVVRPPRPARHRHRRRRSDRSGRMAREGRWRRPHAREDRRRCRRALRRDRLSDKLVEVLSPPVPLELLGYGLAATLRRLEARRAPRCASESGRRTDRRLPRGDRGCGGAGRAPGSDARVVDHGLFPPELVSEILVARGRTWSESSPQHSGS